jgi:integrase
MSDDEGIKQLSPGKWAVRVKRLSARTGRKVNRKATVIGTKADARRKRDELRHELQSLTPMPRKIRLSEFAAQWIEQRIQRGLKASTLRRYRYCLEHIVPALGSLYVNALNPIDVSGYINARTKVAAGYTVLNELRCLRTMAKDSVVAGCAQSDWCARVPAPKVSRYTKKRPNLLDGEQFFAVISQIPDQWRGLVLLIATTGLRWGEASALHWEDIDTKTGEATIIHGNHRGTLQTVKNDASHRTVPLLPEVVKMWGLRKRTGLVFPTRKGGLHKGSPLRRILDAACKAAKVPRVTTHGLRRTFNNLARQVTSREVLKSITGHVTDAMVSHYSIVGLGEKETASRSVAKSMGIVN